MEDRESQRRTAPKVWAHWGLRCDPFLAERRLYVGTPTHEAAVARLAQAIEAGEPRIALVAEAGLGKSIVVDELLTRVRHPRRRLTRAVALSDGASLANDLAQQLGVRFGSPRNSATSWKQFCDALRLLRLQGFSVLLVVEDVQWLQPRDDLARLASIVRLSGVISTILETSRPGDGPSAHDNANWPQALGLLALTRSEVAAYLAAKLFAAGRTEPTFTPQAITCLHALSRGIPRDLDHYASLALCVGASRLSEMITPSITEELRTDFEGQVLRA